MIVVYNAVVRPFQAEFSGLEPTGSLRKTGSGSPLSNRLPVDSGNGRLSVRPPLGIGYFVSQAKPPFGDPDLHETPDPSSDPAGFFDLGRFVEQIEEEQTARMKALLEVSRRMNATLDEEELLPFMMDRLMELTQADHGHLVLLKLSPEGNWDADAELNPWEVKVSVSRLSDAQLNANPPSQTLIRRVVDTRQPMRLDDALSDETIKDSKSAHELLPPMRGFLQAWRRCSTIRAMPSACRCRRCHRHNGVPFSWAIRSSIRIGSVHRPPPIRAMV